MTVLDHDADAPARGGPSIGLQALVALLVTGIFLYYLSFAQRYPHYFTWDMDQHAMLDCVLIQDGVLPDNANHPAFGKYLILTSTQRLAYWGSSQSSAPIQRKYSPRESWTTRLKFSIWPRFRWLKKGRTRSSRAA